MVKDVPIPTEILQEFVSFGEDRKSLANLFDNIKYCVLCNKHRVEKEMPSQTKGQNCLDNYFNKINAKDSENSTDMGKKNSKNNALHKISSSSDSETEMDTLKTLGQRPTIPVEEEEDVIYNREDIEYERTSSKPIIAAMNALGKLKRGISEVNIDDNSSRDSTALVIDEEQLESEKDQAVGCNESVQNKSPSKKSSSSNNFNSEVMSKNLKSPNKQTISSNVNEPSNETTMNFSQFCKNTPQLQSGNKFSTSTPVESSKAVKRKRVEGVVSPDRPLIKRNRDKDLGSENESVLSNNDNVNVVDVKNFKNGDCSLYLEDLQSDDEIYVVQCPREMDLQHLIGKKMELNGESVIKLNINGDLRCYESFSQKDSMGRDVNMVLPSRNEETFKFGVYQLKGSILISEGLDAADSQPSENDNEEQVVKKVSSEDFRLKSQLEVVEQSEVNIEKRKKHKKKDSNSGTEKTKVEINKSLEDETGDTENNLSSPVKKRKKKKDKEEPRVEVTELPEPNLAKTPKKKKKVKIEPDEMIVLEEENRKLENVENDNAENADVLTVKKKKKKKHKEATTQGHNLEEQPEENLNKVLEELVSAQESNMLNLGKKKKKKKDKEKNEPEYVDLLDPVSNEQPYVDVEQDLLIDPAFPEEQPVKKKKKRKHQDEEKDVPILIEDEDYPYISKNRNNHRTEEMDEPVDDSSVHLKLSTFVETDSQHLKKKKKKKKKKAREKSLE